MQFWGKGFLTYNHVHIQRKTVDTIKELSDDTMYVVVHAETGYTKYDHLQKTFIKMIQLEDKNGIWILPAKASILVLHWLSQTWRTYQMHLLLILLQLWGGTNRGATSTDTPRS